MAKTKVLIDYHHGDLFYSLELLFSKRLGWDVYRPIGLDWYEKGYWNVFNHPDTACQYLGINTGDQFEEIKKKYPGCNFLWLNENANETDPGVYIVYDPTKNAGHKAITLEEFKNTKFDLLISSIPQHIAPYNKLINLYQPQAKHVFQVGNTWGHLPGVKNILASTAPFQVPSDINVCFYHQEFDLDMFNYEPPTNHNIVRSYIHWMKNIDLMKQYHSMLPGWIFESCGAGMDRVISLTLEISQALKDSAFTWHYKPEGDGFGHTLHNTFACGRPPIIWGKFYNGKLGANLLEDQQTCIDISKHSFEENIRLIKHFSQPDEHAYMCENAHNKFKSIVDFDAEEQSVRKFIENLR